MASIKIKHSTIKFENMDKKGMFVNVVLSSKYRTEIEKNYDEIAEAWTQIAKSFRNLAGVSSGEVLDMFNRYTNAAETRRAAISKRKAELAKGLRKDIQSYAKTVLDTEAVQSFIESLGGVAVVAAVGQGIPLDSMNQEQPTIVNSIDYKTGDSLGTIVNTGANDRYQGCSNFTDKNGNEYVAAIQCNQKDNDYNLIIFKKDENGNFQQISSKKMQTTHGNSLTTKYNPETGKVELYSTKKYYPKDLDGVSGKDKKFDDDKISKFELDLNNNSITDEEIIKVKDGYTGSVSVDADNDLCAISTGYKLRVTQGEITNDTKYYALKGDSSSLTHQSGCIHGNMFYKVMWDKEKKENYLFTYDLTKTDSDGKVPYTKLLIDQGKKHEIEDVSWDKNLGLVVSINNNKKENGVKSTEFIKI